MNIYESAAASTSQALQAYGRECALTSYVTTYDFESGVATQVPTTAPVFAALFGYGQGAERAMNTLLETGDQRALVEHRGRTPKPGDTITAGLDVWRIIQVETLAPSGVAVFHDCQVRK